MRYNYFQLAIKTVIIAKITMLLRHDDVMQVRVASAEFSIVAR